MIVDWNIQILLELVNRNFKSSPKRRKKDGVIFQHRYRISSEWVALKINQDVNGGIEGKKSHHLLGGLG
jgi:hypothetical protein